MGRTTTVTTTIEYDKQGRVIKEVKTTVENDTPPLNPLGRGGWNPVQPFEPYTINHAADENKGTVLDLTSRIHKSAVDRAVAEVNRPENTSTIKGEGGYL